MKPRKSFLFFLLITLVGCATAHKMTRLDIGMTKDEVIKTLGRPTSVSASQGVEYLNYALSDTGDDAYNGLYTTYFVKVIDGKVASFGRLGDFDSTKVPTQVIKVEGDIKADEKVHLISVEDPAIKLRELKKLADEGIVSKEEFERLKKILLDKIVK